MFFILSKILQFVISPIVWLFCILIWSLLTKKPKRRRNLLLTAVLLLYLFSNAFILDEVMRVWEMPQSKIENNNKVYDYAVVLGGLTTYYDKKNEQIGFNRSVDRLMQAIKLYKTGKVKKIIFTGGDGSILKEIGSEGKLLQKYINKTGIILSNDFIVENNSRNTHENAQFVAKLFISDSLKGNVIIITSAFHIRRALGCFKKEGMAVDYYVADRYSGKRKYVPDHLLLPQTDTFDEWNMLLHEMTGYVVYKILGYSE